MARRSRAKKSDKQQKKKPSIRRRSLQSPPSPDVDLPPLEKQDRVPKVSKVGLSLDRKLDILGVALVFFSFILLLSGVPRFLCRYVECTISESGALTEAILQLLGQIFGWWAIPFLGFMHLLGWWLIFRNFREKPASLKALRIVGFLLLSLVWLAGTHYVGMLTTDPRVLINGEPINAFNVAQDEQGGGYLGAYIYQIMVDAIGIPSAGILLAGLLVVGLMLTFDISFAELADFLRGLGRRLVRLLTRREAPPVPIETLSLPEGETAAGNLEAAAPAALIESGAPPPAPSPPPEPEEKDADSLYGPPWTVSSRHDWILPDHADILEEGSEQEVTDDILVGQARIIEDTLTSFGAPGRVVEINPGPVITQFGVEPDYLEGRGGKKVKVKVSKIAALADDIALALAARSVRVEAPVPGKGFVGVEVPNPDAAIVNLYDVMQSDVFKKTKGPLRIGLGQSVDGEPVVVDLSIMPHLLIAGATGSGKSVCVNAIIACLLLQHTPNSLRFIMIDPKRVELTNYNHIPHLMTPVVTDVSRTVGTLRWVTREMDDRYRRFARAGARNIESYNKKQGKKGNKLPYLIVVVDELADLMMMAPQETESVITRIAQMARATGIHLIISTQRPSVDVVTGLIKANFPARIAFAVASGVDSRVILDMPGAERLLGRGDMLYQAPDASTAMRLQGVFVSDAELDRLVEFWQNQERETVPKAPALAGEAEPEPPPPPAPKPTIREQVDQIIEKKEQDDDDDELYPEAEALVRQMDKASTSMLQRHLRIGYTRASRLMDSMEARGVIAPAEHPSKPRRVLPAEK